MSATHHPQELTGDHFRTWWGECSNAAAASLSGYPCGRFFIAITGLLIDIEALQEEMQTNPTPQRKAEINKLIKADLAEIKDQKQKLRTCLKFGESPTGEN